MTHYPPIGFHFRVSFSGIGDEEMDSRFQSVGGLSVEIETETRKEGGENRFEHVLPVRTKYPLLVLKRGLVVSSALKDWCLDSFNALTFQKAVKDKAQPLIAPKDLVVTMLNEKQEPLMTWNVVHAWPKKWNVSDLNAEQSAIVVESLELQYQYFTVKT